MEWRWISLESQVQGSVLIIIMLYIHIRTFSYTKDQQGIHKVESQKKKSRSLRTEIKKVSTNLEQGYYTQNESHMLMFSYLIL